MIGDCLQIGDKVIVNIPKENWEWGFHPFEKTKRDNCCSGRFR